MLKIFNFLIEKYKKNIIHCPSYNPCEYDFFTGTENNDFILQLLNEEFGMNFSETFRKRKSLADISKDAYDSYDKHVTTKKNNEGNKRDKIPHITHKIWITSHKIPLEIPKKYIKLCIKSLKNFPSDWKHYFWCLDKDKIPKTINYLLKSELNIIVKEIKEIYQDCKAKYIIERYLENDKFTFASDVFRYNLMYLFGGLYFDIGKNINNELIKRIDCFDYVFYTRRTLINSMLASSSGDKFFERFLDLIDEAGNFDNISNIYKERLKPRYNPPWTGSTGLSAAFDLFINSFIEKENKIFFASPDFFDKNNGMGSWRKGKVGNKGVYDFPIDYEWFKVKTHSD